MPKNQHTYNRKIKTSSLSLPIHQSTYAWKNISSYFFCRSTGSLHTCDEGFFNTPHFYKGLQKHFDHLKIILFTNCLIRTHTRLKEGSLENFRTSPISKKKKVGSNYPTSTNFRISYKEVICNEFFRTYLCCNSTRQCSRLQIDNKRDFPARKHFGSARRHTCNDCNATSFVRGASRKR